MTVAFHDPSTYVVAAAFVGLAFMAVGLFVLVFRRNINAEVLSDYVRKLVLANTAHRAVKLCNAADCPATTLTLHLLGTQEPAEALEQGQEREQAGYREAAASVRQVPFADRVAARADREVRELQRSQVRPWGLAAVIGGSAALLLGLAAWLIVSLRTGWRPSWLDGVALAGLIGLVYGARTWQWINTGLRHIAAAVVPLLQPVEKMDDAARAAADAARQAHERRVRR